MLKETLFPLRVAYQGTMGFRNWLYDKGFKKVQKVDAKVISIGNLTVGGTGKTPLTLKLIELLKKRKARPGVVSRGYKRSEKGVLTVDTSPRAALTFGDEPALIKATFPDIPVVVGEKRVEAAQELLAKEKVEVILCDDAFQHRALHRDLNLLLLDVTEPQKNYRPLPVGRARENLVPALQRADILILTKANQVSAEEYGVFHDWLREKVQAPIVRADYILDGFRHTTGRKEEHLKETVIAVSGIAKPGALEKTLEGRCTILKHKSFPDHHRYTDLDVEILLDEASQLKARWVLTTAKDAMKLGQFPRLKERLWIADLSLKLSGDVKDLNEALDRLVR